MNITKTFIKDIMLTGEYNENVRICNTGLLIFIDRERNLFKAINFIGWWSNNPIEFLNADEILYYYLRCFESLHNS